MLNETDLTLTQGKLLYLTDEPTLTHMRMAKMDDNKNNEELICFQAIEDEEDVIHTEFINPNPDMSVITVPQPLGKNPLFLPDPSTEPVRIMVGRNQWLVGATDPDNPTNTVVRHGLDIRHAQVIFTLLHFLYSNLYSPKDKVLLSYNKLQMLCGFGEGAKRRQLLKNILSDLHNIWIQRPHPTKTNYLQTFRILSYSNLQGKDPTAPDKLEYIHFSQAFEDVLHEFDQFFSFHMAVWSKMSSKLAKAIYVFLPSRTLTHTEQNPARIGLKLLYQQLNVQCKDFKSKRKELLTQHKKSVLDQLDGTPIHHNKILRVKLELNSAKDDYNLCSWVETTNKKLLPVEPPVFNGQLVNWWSSSGRNNSSFRARLRAKRSLNGYDIEAITMLGFDYDKDKQYFEMANTLLQYGEFSEILGQMKILFHDGKLNNPHAYLAVAIKNKIINYKPKELDLDFGPDTKNLTC